MARVFMPRIFEPPYVKWVPITITGTGNAAELYVIANGIAYSEEASIKVLPGTTITFYLTAIRGSTGIYPAYLSIDGEKTKVTSTSGYRQDYTVPDTVNAIAIKLSYLADGNSGITVTTS